MAALRARDAFQRYLAAGISSYLAVQSILIIGGNTRLLPLTGVTLPFVSYGGSSLLTGFIAILILLHISNQVDKDPLTLPKAQPFLVSAGAVLLGFLALSLTTGWWAIWRGPDLLERTDNARRTIADRYVQRGAIYDRNGSPINYTAGDSGTFHRVYAYPDLSSIVGYIHPNFGQSGLEASLDQYLRGLRGNPAILIWIDHLLYGQPPPGLDIRLSLDLSIQTRADGLLGNLKGAVVVLNARSGEILAMTSHPVYDANLLDDIGTALLADPDSSLLNRAAQAAYPPGRILEPFLFAFTPSGILSMVDREALYDSLGFFESPSAYLPVSAASTPGSTMRVTPLQVALAASTLSNGGKRPDAMLVTAARYPSEGWIFLSEGSSSESVFLAENAAWAAGEYAHPGWPIWMHTAAAGTARQPFTWSMAGTMPGWEGEPVVVVVLLERDYPGYAAYIAATILTFTITP
jgi:cell division protein FtsI/penicillin-binding protein 2